MVSRCTNPLHKAYDYYGGRGIEVCRDWLRDFEAFYRWSMANGYSGELEIDRINNDGNYEPTNCRWASRCEQMQNTRKRRDARSSKYRGVSWCENAGRWRAQLASKYRRSPHIGLFDSEDDAARAYNQVAKQEFGTFARLNFVEGAQPF